MALLPPVRASTVPAVKAAATQSLVAAMLAAFPTGTPSVTYGFPGEGNFSAEMVFISGATLSTDWAEIGRGARDEKYDLDVYVNVQHSGWSQQEVTERAYAIFQVADRALTANPLGQDPPFHALLVHTRMSERFTSDGRESQVTAVLRCYARI